MFVVTVTFTAPLEEVDRWRPAHLEWLTGLVSRRLFLAAGRQTPPTGGICLASAMPAGELARILATDPYAVNGVATHSVVEFSPRVVADGLEALKG
jgi:uncharacterized protein YciI